MYTVSIDNRTVGGASSCLIIAEISANHNQSYHKALALVKAAKEAGADAVKLQTYTPDTMTFNCDNDYFKIPEGSIWSGQTLHELYQKAYMPWDWQPKLKKEAEKLGILFFSTPYDRSAVDFLSKMEVPAYKIASFELVDIPLIRYIAKKNKPVIMSTGMATLAEIEEAVAAVHNTGNNQLVLLKCVSDYPAGIEDMNLRVIPSLSETFRLPVGLSDHTPGCESAIAAVALGAAVIEKHITLSRSDGGPDAEFSMEVDEFKNLVHAVRTTEKALGEVKYRSTEREEKNKIFRRSLFVVKDVKAGEVITPENVRSIRPAHGLHPRYYDQVLGRHACCDIKRGTPLSWDMVGEKTAN
jgi:pseudaminic acid synthase